MMKQNIGLNAGTVYKSIMMAWRELMMKHNVGLNAGIVFNQ